MSTDLGSRVRELFERVSTLEPPARGAALDSAIARDPEAVSEVRSLLEHHDRTGVILDRTPMALATLLGSPTAPGTPTTPLTPDQIDLPAILGSYTLEECLGSGGMGVVYRARQASPNRPVAVKLIRPEALSPGVLRRFENEAEALGLLDHPGIARVFEAGRAALRGQPRAFIAMELVEGEPLCQYAERKSLTGRERTELLAQVCDAVQFAHRRGVIHRDLKPANILVGADARPRVVDFGVARILARDSASTLTTLAGQVVGTLAYMSPEQARADAGAIDSRSDVYSLGAILFELLCGRTPIDISALSVHGALAAIQSAEPRVPAEFRAAHGRDLEAVVLKALEKDPARRYQHASELGDDLRRSLAGQSVSARIPSVLTQFARFCRRNTQLVAAVSLAMLALAGALALTTAAYAREHAAHASADAARDEALVNLKRYEAVSGFMRTLLGGVKAEVARGKDTALLRSLLETAERTLPELEKRPAAGADAHLLLAEVFRDLGEFTRAEGHLKDALRLYTLAFGEADRNTANAMHNLGALYRGSMRRLDEAEPLIRRAAEIFEASGNADDVDLDHARNSLYLLYLDLGDYARAEPLLRSLRLNAERKDPDSVDALRAGHNHAGALAMIGRPHEAADLARKTYERRARVLGADHPDTVGSLVLYGRMLVTTGRPAEALPLLEEGLRRRTSDFGPSHQLTLGARGYYADALREAGRLTEALSETRAVVDLAVAAPGLGPRHLDTLQFRGAALDMECLVAPRPELLAEADDILAAYRALAPNGSLWTDFAACRRGMALACAGRDAEAEESLKQAYAAVIARVGPRNGTSRRAAAALAWFYTRAGRAAEAGEWAAKAAPPPD